MKLDSRIALIGAGRMGTAMAAGWLRGRRGLPADQLLVVDPSPSHESAVFIRENGLKRVDEIGPRMAKDISLVVLAVKPQMFPEVAAALSTVLNEDCAIVSVMAGITIRTMEEALGERQGHYRGVRQCRGWWLENHGENASKSRWPGGMGQ